MFDSYVEALRSRGYRITPQREMIIEELASTNAHMAAEEIHDAIQKRTKALNIATIYRTLDMLVEEGLACKNDLGSGFVVYAITRHGPHIHLVCRACGQVTEANQSLISDLGKDLQQKYGFAADLRHISLFGVCSECQEENPKQTKNKFNDEKENK
jgi:Fur family ferric uptake transcriptional regulator